MLWVTRTQISSGQPGCTTVAEFRDGAWWIAEYPGRAFTMRQALLAVQLAEVLAINPPKGHPLRRLAATWRLELGLVDLDPTEGGA